MQLSTFVIDTGSPDSYMSSKDVKRLQIAVNDKESSGEVDFGGSRYKISGLPPFYFHLLNEDRSKPHISIKVTLKALKTSKASERKLQTAESLPSILGMDFLKEQKAALYVNVFENTAFLEI
jgi:hypothetical protein